MTATAQTPRAAAAGWRAGRIDPGEIEAWRPGGRDFVEDGAVDRWLREALVPDAARVRDILARSRAVQTLEPAELAALLRVEDPALWAEMRTAAAAVKRHVYDNRIVTFAPLYLSNRCVNDCLYCGLRRGNPDAERRTLGAAEIRREVEVLAGRIGHKRLILVCGEHPASDIDWLVESIREVYAVRVPARIGVGRIRRVNVNAPPLRTAELRRLREAGIGTYQVFQETYHRETYARVHPSGFKSDYAWRLYAMHRALATGIEDVGIGALFGLHDWRFEVMGLLLHARELEARFGVGPHTISFPRLEPAANAPRARPGPGAVSDAALERIVVLLRLAVPHAGLILTAREDAEMRRRLIPLGCTQTDASSRVGTGAYADGAEGGEQFTLGDLRSLDEVVRDLAEMGLITSFCTAGYRCGRTGACIMDLLRSGAEGRFCKLNAVLTFREWLDDFASPETARVGETVLAREIEEIRTRIPGAFPAFLKAYERTARGERDVYF